MADTGKAERGRWLAAVGVPEEMMKKTALAGLDFLLGFTLSAARVAGELAPFGVAAAASGGAGIGGLCRLLGAMLGYVAVGGLDWGIRLAAGCVMVFTLVFAFRDVAIGETSWFTPLCAGAVMALTGFLASFSRELGGAEIAARVALEAVLAGGGTYFFREALRQEERTTERSEVRHMTALAVLLACCLMALTRVRIAQTISLGRVGALLLVMLCSFKGGAMTGAAAGAAAGAAMDLSSGAAPFFTMAYAFSALLSGVFAKQGRLIYLISFIISNALLVAVSWAYTAQLGALFETFAATVIFMLIPPGFIDRVGELISPPRAGMGESGLRRFAARRVEDMASAFSEVCAVVCRVTEPQNDSDVARIFDRAADLCCVTCKKKDECWTANYIETLDALNSVAGVMDKRGQLEVTDLPERFRTSCVNLPPFIAAVNGELRSRAYRRAYRARLEENRAAAWGQYRDFAGILERLSGELGSMNGADPLSERRLVRYLRTLEVDADAAVFRDGGGRLRAVIEGGRLGALTADPDYLVKLSTVLGARLCRPNGGGEGRVTLLEAEPLAVSVGVAAMRKKGESVSGDRGTYFKTDSGVLCVILSDGMGAGAEAARESVEAVAILEKFLRSGVEPAVAMKILNSVMLLKNGDEWGFATVDLMCVDLFSGETAFYKYGAAPSYVRSGGRVRRISGEALAAGLASPGGVTPDVTRMRLKPGSLAVIASDGVIADENDGWLRSLMKESVEEDMKNLARQVIKRAGEEYGHSDDMTVLAVRMDARC